MYCTRHGQQVVNQGGGQGGPAPMCDICLMDVALDKPLEDKPKHILGTVSFSVTDELLRDCDERAKEGIAVRDMIADEVRRRVRALLHAWKPTQ